MGRLTDALRKASEKLGGIESGIDRMSSLSEDLAQNTANVADASLRLGYAYAKAEDKSKTDVATQDETAASTALEIAAQLKETQSSQNTLQTWNDLYRLQQVLVIQFLEEQNVESNISEQIKQIFKLRSIKKAPTLAEKLLKLAPEKIRRLLKKQLKYRAHLLNDEL